MTTSIQREWLFGTMREPPGVDVGRSVVAKNATLFENRPEPPLRRQRSEEDIAHAKRLFIRQGMFVKKDNQSKKVSKQRSKSPVSKIRLATTGQACYHPHLDVIRARIAMSPYTTEYKSDYSEEVLDLMNKTNLMSEEGAAGEYQITELTKKEINSKFEKIRTHIHPFSHVNTYKDPVSTVYNHRFPISPERIETVREQKEARRLQEEKEKQRKAIAHDKVLRNASSDLHLAESFFSLPTDRVNISQFLHDPDRVYLKLGDSFKTAAGTTKSRATSAKLSQSKSMAIATRIIEEAEEAALRARNQSTHVVDAEPDDKTGLIGLEDNLVASIVAEVIKLATITVSGVSVEDKNCSSSTSDTSIAMTSKIATTIVTEAIKVATSAVCGIEPEDKIVTLIESDSGRIKDKVDNALPMASNVGPKSRLVDQQQLKTTVLMSPHAMDDIERSYLRLGPPTINPPGPPALLSDRDSIATAAANAVEFEKRYMKLRPVSAGATVRRTGKKWNQGTMTSSTSQQKEITDDLFRSVDVEGTASHQVTQLARVVSNLTVDVDSHDDGDHVPPSNDDTDHFYAQTQFPMKVDMSSEEFVDSLADFFAQKRFLRRSTLSGAGTFQRESSKSTGMEKGPSLQPLTPVAGPTFGIVTPLGPAQLPSNTTLKQPSQQPVDGLVHAGMGFKGMTSADRLRLSTARASRPSSALPATASSLHWQGPLITKKKSNRDKRFVPHQPRQRVDII